MGLSKTIYYYPLIPILSVCSNELLSELSTMLGMSNWGRIFIHRLATDYIWLIDRLLHVCIVGSLILPIIILCTFVDIIDAKWMSDSFFYLLPMTATMYHCCLEIHCFIILHCHECLILCLLWFFFSFNWLGIP